MADESKFRWLSLEETMKTNYLFQVMLPTGSKVGVRRNDETLWLEFVTASFSTVAFDLNALAEGRGMLIETILTSWIEENR